VLVEATDNVEDGVRSSEITKGVCHVLELTTVVGDGEVALDKVLKGGVEVEGVLFAIGKELVF
jgi:hypothetical protein